MQKYTKGFLERTKVVDIFLKLNEERLLLGADKYCSEEEFCEMIGKNFEVLAGARERNLVVLNTDADSDSYVNVRETYKRMRKHFLEQYEKRERKLKVEEQTRRVKEKHGTIDISVEVNPEDVGRFNTKSAHPDELVELEKKWALIVGDKIGMPNIQHKMVKRLLWNLRGLEITKQLLDGVPNESIMMMMMDKWDLTYKQSRQFILRVEKSISKSVDKGKKLMVGMAYMRYERIFHKLTEARDYKAAAVVNKEIINLFGIDVMAKEIKDSGESAEDGHMAILDAIEKGQEQEALPPPEEVSEEDCHEDDKSEDDESEESQFSPDDVGKEFPDDN